jgi:hypothetical protein
VAGPGHTRKAIRFPLEAPISFWWMDSGVVKRSEGKTRDVSEGGAFVLASTCPPPGIQIGFKLYLPALPGSKRKTRLEADGQVIRVKHLRGRKECEGFAILTEHMILRLNNDIYERGDNADNEHSVEH